MAKYREILTKAIIGKGTNKIEENQVIEVDEEISRALGCWIINHQSSIKVEDEKIFLIGQYEVYVLIMIKIVN